jgi:ABC-type long-subunit fatty acid transport system fused permease/ATPase subunit
VTGVLIMTALMRLMCFVPVMLIVTADVSSRRSSGVVPMSHARVSLMIYRGNHGELAVRTKSEGLAASTVDFFPNRSSTQM